jgi:hypothetical protein
MIWDASSQSGTAEYFFHDLLRKYVVVFGRTFSTIMIQRSDANSVITDIKVSLEYGPKEKSLERLLADPDIDRPYSVLLPKMTFEIEPPGISYDTERKIGTIEKIVQRNPDNKNQLQIMYTAAPYNINFALYIYVKNQEDGAKILEQILPFFQPAWVPRIELIPEMNLVRDIPIEIRPNMDYQDLYDKEFKTRRVIIYTLHFRMRALFYGPERTKPIIKFTTLNLRAGVFTNNQITISYGGANSGLPAGANIYSYSNNLVTGSGVINQTSWMNLANNVNTGTLQVNVITGSFTGNTLIYTFGNTVVANVVSWVNGIYDNDGNLLSNPGIAEIVVSQPGETSTGHPTANISQTVDWSLIDISDDYGFASQVKGGEVT